MNLAARRSALLQNKVVMRLGVMLVITSMIFSWVAVPKAKAVAGVDDAAVGLSAVLLYIDATGIETGLAVAGSSAVAALEGGTTALIGEAAAAGALTTTSGVALTSATAALTTIGTGVIIAAGAFILTYEAYMLIKDYVDWLNENKLTQTGANIVYSADGYCALADGRSIIIPTSSSQYLSNSNAGKYPFFPTGDDGLTFDTGKYIRLDSSLWSFNVPYVGTTKAPTDVDGFYAYLYSLSGTPWLFTVSTGLNSNGDRVVYNSGSNNGTAAWSKITDFTTPVSQELTLSVPDNYSQPEMIDGQSLTLCPNYPSSYSDTDIIQGIPQSIADGTLNPAPPSVINNTPGSGDDPTVPEDTPDIDDLGLPDLGAALTTRFPFSIPWDIYRGLKLLASPAVVPKFKVDFYRAIDTDLIDFGKGDTELVIDFGYYPEFYFIGELCRWTSTIGYCLFLASATKRFIWTA